ncbi:MAG: inhibitor of apoptosis iap [Cotesia congregata filamentous virus 2]
MVIVSLLTNPYLIWKEYRFGINRYNTFIKWQWLERAFYPDTDELSQCGFYYTGVDDKIQCFQCGLITSANWDKKVGAIEKHLILSQECPFANAFSQSETGNFFEFQCGNIPIKSESSQPLVFEYEAYDFTDYLGLSNNIHATKVNIYADCKLLLPTKSNTSDNNRKNSLFYYTEGLKKIMKHYEPRFKKYSIENDRLKTFKRWTNGNQSPEELSKAGFFSIGIDDYIVCYHCGGGLYKWLKYDDVWIEHAKNFNCYHVASIKGDDFFEYAKSLDYDIPIVSFVLEKNIYYLTSNIKYFFFCYVYFYLFKDSKTKDDDNKKDINTSINDKNKSIENSSDELCCKICFEKPISIIFYPCAHAMTCNVCCLNLIKCAVCRSVIEFTSRVIIS